MDGLEALTKAQLVDEALRALEESVVYETSEDVARFLSSHVHELKVLSEPLPRNHPTEPLVALISRSRMQFDDLSSISASLRDAVIGLWAYKLTRTNLLIATSEEDSLSLDAIRSASSSVYEYVINNLQSFVEELTEHDCTISGRANNSESVAIINDVVKRALKLLPSVLELSASSLIIEDIAAIDVRAWGELARRSKFRASYMNVKLYEAQVGLDESVAKLLISRRRFDDREQTNDEATEMSVMALAQKLITAGAIIPDPSARVMLAKSLNVKGFMKLPDPIEPGMLPGLMIGHGLADDSRSTFQELVAADVDWHTLEFAISMSSNFADFLEPSLLSRLQALQLLESKILSDDLKRLVVERGSEFLSRQSYESQLTLAREAVRLNASLPTDAVHAMATVRVEATYILPLLTPLLDSLDLARLAPILTALGSDFEKISKRSYYRPKFPKERHIQLLVSRLYQLGIVSSIDDKGSHIRVNMRHP